MGKISRMSGLVWVHMRSKKDTGNEQVVMVVASCPDFWRMHFDASKPVTVPCSRSTAYEVSVMCLTQAGTAEVSIHFCHVELIERKLAI